MAGTKRGGFGTFKKSYAKKRSSPDGEDDAPQAHKKSKKDDEEADAKAIEPKLGKDDDGNSYISVSKYIYIKILGRMIGLTGSRKVECKRKETCDG